MKFEDWNEAPKLLRMVCGWSEDNNLKCPRCGGTVISVDLSYSPVRESTPYAAEPTTFLQIKCRGCDYSSEELSADSDTNHALEHFADGVSDTTRAHKILGIEDMHPKAEETEPEMACNDNIVPYMKEVNLSKDEILDDVEDAFQGVLAALRIDTDNDHNTQDTARRVAKMYVNEIFRGRYEPMPEVTAFPNAKNYDQIYTVGPITVRGTCAHHFQGIVGKCWIGIYPGEKVIGLSKFNRLVDWIASRPSIQEEMTEQIADVIQEITDAKGIAVIVRAEHLCMTHRGVREHESDMTTSVMRGVFRDDVSKKQEFLSLIDMK